MPPPPPAAGFHLATADCLDRIPPTVADMAALSPAVVVAGHCTGWRAQAALQAALPGRCMPCSVGCSYEFSAPTPS
jgi:7,8-dihydropterin-6-yl-methyl-4-(beta-D-ribofuranosyl)aminobenzene 5'-phosphate synthase